MNKLLTAGDTLATLGGLRESVEELVAREAAAVEGRDRDSEAISRKYDLLKARQRKAGEARYQQAKETAAVERQQAEERFVKRGRWIEEAHQRARTEVVERAEQIRSQQKYENQKDLLQANRQAERDRKAAESTHRDFLTELELEGNRLEGIKGIAWDLFRGYPFFRRSKVLDDGSAPVEVDATDEYQLLEALRQQLTAIELGLKGGWTIVLKVFSWVPVWVLLVLIAGVGGVAQGLPELVLRAGASPDLVVRTAAVVWSLAGALYVVGLLLAGGAVRSYRSKLYGAVDLVEKCRGSSVRSCEIAATETEAQLDELGRQLEVAWNDAKGEADRLEQSGLKKLDAQADKLRQWYRRREALLAARWARPVGENQAADGNDLSLEELIAEQQRLEQEVVSRFEQTMAVLVDDWSREVPARLRQLEEHVSDASKVFRPWDPERWDDWDVSGGSRPVARFAELQVRLGAFVSVSPIDARLAWDKQSVLRLPLSVHVPQGESILIETEGSGPSDVMAALNGVVVRLLTSAPVGRLRFTLIDPVGLGQNFAGLMHLTDYDEQVINRRIWTQTSQIDQCLKDLTEHMEKVTQVYLRNEYESLADYNAAAGNIAEKYHVVVVADFPAGFSEPTLKRLQSIAVSGPRCGVFLIVHRDKRQPLADDAVLSDLREHCVSFDARPQGGYQIGSDHWSGTKLTWDHFAEPGLAMDLVRRIGEASEQSNRVEVPFSHVVPREKERWTLETRSMLRIPIGRTGASKLQYLTLGRGTQQHVLIAGKTGSGKSTLFHVIVSNLALWCRPDQVEFYLVDFKKGVEFKCYARNKLPHARVVAIESDREFGLSVLERVDDELRQRGDLFRRLGVQDLAGYHAASEAGRMPRTLLMIDEFQEFFVEDDRVSQQAAVLLDRIVRQGRAFGIHVILGSQTLGGAYTLARTTLAQMVVRVALQCDEADSYLIMDESNAAPRLLSRPGEGIYNDAGGAVEGNSPFQTVWLSDAEREDALETITSLAATHEWAGESVVVFEGNEPARLEDNAQLFKRLSEGPLDDVKEGRAWLGAPNAIKGPTEALFAQQSGSHLLVLGQSDELSFAVSLSSILSLAAQYPADEAEFVLIDAFPEQGRYGRLWKRLQDALPHTVTTLSGATLETLMGNLDGELERRLEGGGSGRSVFVFVLGLQQFKKLRPEDEFSFSASEDEGERKPGAVFDRLVREGSTHGIRMVTSIDSYQNSQRYLSRKALAEFEMRVLFQMSANDSAALIDSTKASQLGLHRALFYNERRGYLETFRPYAVPDEVWLQEAFKALSSRQGAKAPVQ